MMFGRRPFRVWPGACSGGMPRRPVPERGTPPDAKPARSQGDAAAHPPELCCANEAIASAMPVVRAPCSGGATLAPNVTVFIKSSAKAGYARNRLGSDSALATRKTFRIASSFTLMSSSV